MNDYFSWFYNKFVESGISIETARYLNVLINTVLLTIVLVALNYIIKKIIVNLFSAFTIKTKSTYDDFLVKSNFPRYVARIIPFFILRGALNPLLSDFQYLKVYSERITDVYLIILIVWIFRSIIKASTNYLRNNEQFKDKPLDSYAQIITIFIWFIGIVNIFSVLTQQGIVAFLTTLGATSAVFLLIFRDTILGFVASIQVSVNDMVRIGDWIVLEKFGADGNVIEINLTTVKVSNWDKTITTIPTYSLISDSFKNWRGMQESGGRRIKRSIIIKNNSVKFLNEKELKRFSKIQTITEYIRHRQRDIDKHNIAHNIDKSMVINGRNQTNLGLFRKYCDTYLKQHSALNKDMMIMTRHLEPNGKGIPLEVYAFSKDKRWLNYEHIIADVFEHLIAAIPYFDLELYQEPSSKDVKELSLKTI